MKRSPLLALGIVLTTASWTSVARADLTTQLLETESVPTATIIPLEVQPQSLTKQAFLEGMLGTSNALDLLDRNSLLIVTSDMDIAVLTETWLTDLQVRQQPKSQALETQSLVAQIDSSSFIGDQRQPVIEEFEPFLDDLNPLFSPPSAPFTSPPGSAGPPTAYGINWGQAFVGGSFISAGQDDGLNLGTISGDADGSLSAGMGFGNAVTSVGLEVFGSLISLSNSFGDNGQIGFKLHKVFPAAGNLGIGVGWTNPITWGDDANAEDDTYYGAISKAFLLRPQSNSSQSITLTAGVGSGIFRSKGAIEADDNPPNFFGNIGFRVADPISINLGWTGNILNAGLGVAPFRRVPLTFSLNAADLTNNLERGTRFQMNAAYGISF